MQRQDNSTRKIYGVYIPSLLTMKVVLPITEVGKNMKENLEKIISKRNEGKCIAEGFTDKYSQFIFDGLSSKDLVATFDSGQTSTLVV